MMKKTTYAIIAMFVAIAIAGCQDDDSFSASPSNLLTFSTDTVRMDTVFSTVPTATKTFWVFNHSGDGIRCTNVRLENGSRSGFRVNVDGVYLGQEGGYQTSDVELRKKDSIRVFVELTSKATGQAEPQLVEDNLVFTLESGMTQKVNLNAYSWDALKYTNLEIATDTMLTGDKPIIIYGGLKVDSAATLTLAAGTTLYFHADAGMEVYGQLLAKGEAGREVVLRGDRLDRMFDYLPYDLVSGQWQGIRFRESSYDNRLSFTDIHGTFDGVVCDSSDVARTTLTLDHATIHNCQGSGLYAENSKIEATNSIFSNTLGDCVAIRGGDATFTHCTMAQFYPFDSRRGDALSYAATAGSPLLRMDCINSLVTGYAADVVTGSTESDDLAFNYRFVSSILRTPEVEDTAHITDVVFEEMEDTATVQGEKHFVLVDINRQYYDFHLSAVSTAIDKGNSAYAASDDRDGTPRDDRADIGCFERIKE